MKKLPLSDFKKKETQNSKSDKGWGFNRPPFLNLIYISLAINVFLIVSIFFIKRHLPPEVPLFYGLAEGEDQLVAGGTLVLAPFISLVIVVVNSAVSLTIKSELLRRTLIITGFGVTILSLVTAIQIILLVGSFL